mmetsp:Transcript_10889/g.16254  ORF Transcript_10889/g.16254 Transcript_10889/m.16254 type:complete len:93 (+) Transcript_10889:286-564(+)
MEENKVGPAFSSAASALSSMYKEGQLEGEKSYERGKSEFYQETLQWMLNEFNGNLKYVPIESLMNYLNSKVSNPRSFEVPTSEQPNKRFKTL